MLLQCYTGWNDRFAHSSGAPGKALGRARPRSPRHRKTRHSFIILWTASRRPIVRIFLIQNHHASLLVVLRCPDPVRDLAGRRFPRCTLRWECKNFIEPVLWKRPSPPVLNGGEVVFVFGLSSCHTSMYSVHQKRTQVVCSNFF